MRTWGGHLLFTVIVLAQFLFASQFVDNAKTHQVTCIDCPESVATIISEGMWGRGFCRGSLIAADMVITSGHCVEELVETGCNGKVAIKVGDETVGCEKIEYFEIDESLNRPDIAILKLSQSVKSKPAKLKAQSFADNEDLHYYKSIYDFSSDASSMVRVDCKTKKYSSSAGSFFTNSPIVISIKDCPFDDGDSGSPIYNSNGELVAVLQGGMPMGAIERLKQDKLENFDNKSYLDLLAANFNFNDSSEVVFNPVIAATTIKCLTFLSGETCEQVGIQDFTINRLNEIESSFKDFIVVANERSSIQWEYVKHPAFEELLSSKAPKDHSMADFYKLVTAKAVCQKKMGIPLKPELEIQVSVDANFALYYEATESLTQANSGEVSALPICGDI